MNIYLIIHIIKYKEFDISMFYLNYLQLLNVSTDTTVIFKDKVLNEKIK